MAALFALLQIIHNCFQGRFRRINLCTLKVGAPVKDIYAVLLQKEKDVERVRHEIESLRYVATILTDEVIAEPERMQAAAGGTRNKWPLDMRDIQRGETGA